MKRVVRPAGWIGLLLLAGQAVQADELGRLFTSSADRARIDASRDGTASLPDTAAAAPAPSGQLLLNGTLTGSDGKRAVWINGARVADDQEVRLLSDGRVRVPLDDGIRQRDLKPGQGLDKSSGEVFEGYQRAPMATAATPDALADAAQAAGGSEAQTP